MKCKTHTVDSTSTIGVCASCLRDRLFSLAASEDNDHHHPPDAGGGGGGDDSLASSNNRFFTTTQVGSSSSEKVFDKSVKKKQTGLSRFTTFFTTRSNDFSPSSSSWFSPRSKKQTATCYIEDVIAGESNHMHRYCKGMSPANGVESVEDSPGRARRTPPGRRKTATMALCLSPLVRAKPPNGSFGYTGGGEMKSPVKPHISTAASFTANRSKKLAGLGRADHRR